MPIVAPLIAECADFGGLRRAWIVQGEKWCTARRTAQRTVDIVAKRCGLVVAESVSSRKVLYSRSAGLANAVPVTTAPASQLSDVLADQDELLVYSLRYEMVRTLSDLLLRRTNIGAGRYPGQEVVDRISRLAASELGWEQDERQRNVDAIHRHNTFPDNQMSALG